MARRSPGALRAEQPTPTPWTLAGPQISGISRLTQTAIHRLEALRLRQGAVADALDDYRRFLKRTGKILYLPKDEPPACDPVDARDILGEALRHLPPRARAELGRIVGPLDRDFLHRTLPDPHASSRSRWHASAWWRRRLSDH
ncbi:hypothetical protein AB0I28_04905 [Phytomonospora sp. NPDC050363]|uniref:hypothetical protein n=1 Tax=Phytomonospora sp. NPDC050363 TaxID=3155642 RepID=UPI0033D5B68B